jgi:hypothetical protein
MKNVIMTGMWLAVTILAAYLQKKDMVVLMKNHFNFANKCNPLKTIYAHATLH